MRRYLATSLRRLVREGRVMTLLTVAGVALGVAAVTGVQLLSGSALAAFDGGVRAVTGTADLVVLPAAGALPDTCVPRILGTPSVAAAWPLVRVRAAVLPDRTTWLELVGTDLLAAPRLPWRPAAGTDGPAADSTVASLAGLTARALGEPGWTAIAPELATRLGVAVGDTLVVAAGSRPVRLRVGALVDFRRVEPLAPAELAVMDIARAQDLFHRTGRLDEVAVRLTTGADPAAVARALAGRLGPSARILTPEQRRGETAGLLAAFRLNLTALSLVSVVVGLFLVYSTVLAVLVRRRREFGLLRALGATRMQVAGAVLLEAAWPGLLGTVAGLPLGIRLADAARHLVSVTLTDIYLLESIERLVLPPWLVPLGLVVGLGGALLGALLPALELGRRDVRELLQVTAPHEATAERAPRYALAGLLLMVATGAWYVLQGHGHRGAGFVLGVGPIAGLPLLTPLLLRGLTRHLRPRGLGVVYAVKDLASRLQTSATAVAAVGVAASMLVGVTLLIASFRGTLETWLVQTLPADVYVTTAGWDRGRGGAVMEPVVIDRLARWPGVRGVEKLRQVALTVAGRPVRVNGLVLAMPDTAYHLPMWRGRSDVALAGMRRGGAVISEPLARRLHLGVGDTLELVGRDGPRGLPVTGVVRDYSTEHGLVYVAMTTLARLVGPGPVNNVALYLEDGVDAAAVVATLRHELADHALVIRVNAELRRQVTDIFDQTFAVTRLLQWTALVIAVCGVALALSIRVRERAAQIALLRALGLSRRRLYGLLAVEGGMLGLLGAACGTVGGIALALLLIHVINPAWFGWSLRTVWAWGTVARQLVLLPVAAVVAAIPPALLAGRVRPEELGRDEG